MKGRIEIRTLEKGLQDFRATWKAVAAGKKVTPAREPTSRAWRLPERCSRPSGSNCSA